jgi:predicted dehydrogenase
MTIVKLSLVQDTSVSKKLSIGIAGAGGIARQRHLPGFARIDGVQVVSIANRSRESSERVTEEFGIPRVHDSWRELVADPDVDAVVIGTWPYLHLPITLAALERGKHVLTEGRMAMNADEARQMLAAACAHPGLVTQVVPGPFTLSVDRTVQELLADGYLGQLQAVDVRISSGFVNPDAPMNFRTDRDLSGVNTLSLGIYYESLMRWIGPAHGVTARTRVAVPYRRDPAKGQRRAMLLPDHVEVLLDLADGALGRMHISAVAGLMPGPEIWLFGSDGTLRFEQQGERLSGAHKPETELQLIDIPPEKRGGWHVEDEFVAAIRGEQPVRLTTFADGVRYMEFTEAVHRSSAEQRTIHLPLVS